MSGLSELLTQDMDIEQIWEQIRLEVLLIGSLILFIEYSIKEIVK